MMDDKTAAAAIVMEVFAGLILGALAHTLVRISKSEIAERKAIKEYYDKKDIVMSIQNKNSDNEDEDEKVFEIRCETKYNTPHYTVWEVDMFSRTQETIYTDKAVAEEKCFELNGGVIYN